jgi:hypothetical protein
MAKFSHVLQNDKVRVYFKDKTNKRFIEGILKELSYARNRCGDKRFSKGYVILKGKFRHFWMDRWFTSDVTKIPLSHVTVIHRISQDPIGI